MFGDKEGGSGISDFVGISFYCCCFLLLGFRKAPWRKGSFGSQFQVTGQHAALVILTSTVRNRAVKYVCSLSWPSPLTQLSCCRVMKSVVVTGSSTLTQIFKKMSHRHIQKPVESRQFITETPFPVGFAYIKLKNKTTHYRGHSM